MIIEVTGNVPRVWRRSKNEEFLVGAAANRAVYRFAPVDGQHTTRKAIPRYEACWSQIKELTTTVAILFAIPSTV